MLPASYLGNEVASGDILLTERSCLLLKYVPRRQKGNETEAHQFILVKLVAIRKEMVSFCHPSSE